MISQNGPAPRRYLPHVLVATFLVAVLPLLLVYLLQASGRLHSPLLSLALAVAISLASTRICSSYWTRRPQSSDIVFSDLMIWGWVRRLRTERRLQKATELLGLDGQPGPKRVHRLHPTQQAEVLQELASALEARDPYTQGHTRRVTRHSYMIARKMGLPSDEVARIRAAAAVHDVGKIRVPREILNKPGRLTDDEFEVMKAHATDGAAMVARIGDPEISAMVRHHHEQLDGSGYPDALAGAEIPLGARIIAVADTFDAMTSSRPYRSSRQHKDAIEVLKKCAGSQLDGSAVKAFLGYYSGRRGIAWWGLLTTVPSRFLGRIGDALQSAGAAPLAKSAAVVGATAVLSSSLATAPRGVRQHAGTRQSGNAKVVDASGYHGDTRISVPRKRSSRGSRPASGSRPARRPAAATPVRSIPPAGGGAGGTQPAAATEPVSNVKPPESGSGPPDPGPGPGPGAVPLPVELPDLPLPETPKTPKPPDVPLPKIPGSPL
jgi:HD domain-containing protein